MNPFIISKIAGGVTSLVGAGLSFAAAAKQRKLQVQAQADADAAMAQARKSLELNYYDALSVQKEPYELQREAAISQGAQAIQAAQEGDRGAAAAAGRVQMAQNEAQAAIRTQMGKEMQDIQKLQLTEDSRLRDIGTQLDLQEVEGAQQAASDAQRAATAYTQQGIQGVTNMFKSGAEAAPLYGGKQGQGTPIVDANKTSLQTTETAAQNQAFANTVEGVGGIDVTSTPQYSPYAYANPFSFNGQ